METCILELGTERARVIRASCDPMGRLATREIVSAPLSLGTSIDDAGGIGRREGADALSIVAELVERAQRDAPGTDLHFIAVDALAAAENATAFAQAIGRRHRASVCLLSSRETARLSYGAARADRRALSGQAIVAHLGEGTVDLASGTRATLDLEGSLPLGAARLIRAFECGIAPLPSEDAGALFSLVRLSAGPFTRRLREWGADSFVVAGRQAAAVRTVARAFGFLDERTDSLGRLELHAFASEALNAMPEDLLRAGISLEAARHLGITAVTIDALSDLLGQRTVFLSSAGPAEGAALEILSRPSLRLAAGAESPGRY